jgi:hypothetical protein
MPRRSIVTFLLLAMALPIARAARADWWNGPGRYLGVGWSDGYHAKNACPPWHNRNCPNCQPQVPWWATPAPPLEALPHPAAAGPQATARPRVPAGASLFRQPGEGTTVAITDVQPAGSDSP